MLERLTVGPIGENAYILETDGACILVDPGDEARRILSFLDSRSLVPSLVVATHGHLDHTSALPELLAAWNSRGIAVPLAAHSADAAYFGAGG
jgi:hydroxyacylglutathione hydrolase